MFRSRAELCADRSNDEKFYDGEVGAIAVGRNQMIKWRTKSPRKDKRRDPRNTLSYLPRGIGPAELAKTEKNAKIIFPAMTFLIK